MWEPVIALLPDFHCLAVDLPEHGCSQAVGPFSIKLAAELSAQIIQDRAREGRAVVVGLSEGAQVAVQVLADDPARVEKALISSALVRPLPGMGWLTPSVLRWTYRLMMAPLKNWDAWIQLNRKYSAGIPTAYHALFKKNFQEMTESGFTNLMAANQRFRLPAGLEKVHVPTLVTAGIREYRAMRQSALDLASVLPNGQAMQLDLGQRSTLAEEHNWALTRPDLFARTVRGWVQGMDLPAELTTMNQAVR